MSYITIVTNVSVVKKKKKKDCSYISHLDCFPYGPIEVNRSFRKLPPVLCF